MSNYSNKNKYRKVNSYIREKNNNENYVEGLSIGVLFSFLSIVLGFFIGMAISYFT